MAGTLTVRKALKTLNTPYSIDTARAISFNGGHGELCLCKKCQKRIRSAGYIESPIYEKLIPLGLTADIFKAVVSKGYDITWGRITTKLLYNGQCSACSRVM